MNAHLGLIKVCPPPLINHSGGFKLWIVAAIKIQSEMAILEKSEPKFYQPVADVIGEWTKMRKWKKMKENERTKNNYKICVRVFCIFVSCLGAFNWFCLIS